MARNINDLKPFECPCGIDFIVLHKTIKSETGWFGYDQETLARAQFCPMCGKPILKTVTTDG
jgi:hypothetical protein